jgi:multisubunit Na+/H+ antiporter MnhE subunit
MQLNGDLRFAAGLVAGVVIGAILAFLTYDLLSARFSPEVILFIVAAGSMVVLLVVAINRLLAQDW